ncbi:MAG: TauD/TfdA family dioxygenase, partial [Rickettsiales bacterium]
MTELDIHPSGAALGAEVRGIDLAADAAPETAKALRDAWHRHIVLLFRDQKLDDPALLNAARLFGPLQEGGAQKYLRRGGFTRNSRLMTEHPEITVISNLNEAGEPLRENAGLGSGE